MYIILVFMQTVPKIPVIGWLFGVFWFFLPYLILRKCIPTSVWRDRMDRLIAACIYGCVWIVLGLLIYTILSGIHMFLMSFAGKNIPLFPEHAWSILSYKDMPVSNALLEHARDVPLLGILLMHAYACDALWYVFGLYTQMNGWLLMLTIAILVWYAEILYEMHHPEYRLRKQFERERQQSSDPKR